MSIPQNIERYMQNAGLHYQLIHHETTTTALANASKINCDARDMAKVVAVRIAGEYGLLVLPSNERVLFSKLKEMLGESDIEMLSEYEMNFIFSDSELGAQVPFGSFYNIKTYLSSHFGHHYSFYFYGGTHSDVIQVPVEEFRHFENPYIIDFSIPYSDYEYYSESFSNPL